MEMYTKRNLYDDDALRPYTGMIYRTPSNKEEIIERKLRSEDINEVCCCIQYAETSEVEEFAELLNNESEQFLFGYELDWFHCLCNETADKIREHIDKMILSDLLKSSKDDKK